MLIGVVAETDPAETRVAATPETVKKFIGLGAEVAVESGAGAQGWRGRRGLFERGRADRSPPPRRSAPTSCSRCAGRARPRSGARSNAARWSSRSWILTATPRRSRRWRRPASSGFAMELMPRITRAQVMDVLSEPGQSRRLPRRHRRRRRIWPRPADDDDAGRHRSGRQALRHGRRRRRPAGDRDRAAPRRDRHRHRRAPGDQGAGRVARREIRRRRGRGVQAGRDRRRLRQGNVGRLQGQAGGAHRLAHRQAGHRHHDRADPRPPGAAARSPPRWCNRCARAR